MWIVAVDCMAREYRFDVDCGNVEHYLEAWKELCGMRSVDELD